MFKLFMYSIVLVLNGHFARYYIKISSKKLGKRKIVREALEPTLETKNI